MESVVTLSDAKARFSEIVEKAVNGDEFIVTRMGKPVVRISRFVTSGERRKLGDLAGQIRISEDFDDWPPDLREALGMAEPE
ncbi:MAG: type II toxin-antitoxin system prevent-host-death family antitoxin [Immundisolibacterales bacterium]|nr:type II toxin-antitoxin system prevent-host-death family antitoxin [Immundisolibacterales bacterium]